MKARARHILVSKIKRAKQLKLELERGADFGELAELHSTCPSGKKGGDLGQFSKGEMVKAFDQIVFKENLGKVHGPVSTEFGFHLIEILERQ
jgi:peptidyl-prolyl cis-trans isomerase C